MELTEQRFEPRSVCFSYRQARKGKVTWKPRELE